MRAARAAAFVLSLTTCASAGKLDGQRVLVTGGGRGIGRAISLFCASEGARVAILSRSKTELEEVAATAVERGTAHGVEWWLADVTDSEAVDRVVREVSSSLGAIDLLINNAGASCSKGPLHEQSAEDFRALLDLNVVAVMSVSSAVLRHSMLGRGRGQIINISSKAGKVGITNMGPYVASKFALEGLTATLAAELSNKGILVNSISPGMVDTKAFPKAPGRPGVRTADSVADGLLHIMSSGRTGHYLHVDEFDAAVAAGAPDAALKPIDEPAFKAPAVCAATEN